METEFAPAKINLTLHVTGRRADGYHLLDSLVAFVDIGDRVRVSAANSLSLTISGPRAAALSSGDDNLVLRAARAFKSRQGAALDLEKHLPLASGIGGGSSDAAATLRALSRLWQTPIPEQDAVLALGADVPVCLNPRGQRMSGIGERLAPVDMPEAWMVLVNPGVSVTTPAVFKALSSRTNSPMPAILPAIANLTDLTEFLLNMRNDLEPAAITLAPAIADAKAAMMTRPGCLVARMSGSGATCFGLFGQEDQARSAALAIQAAHSAWWVARGRMIS